MPNLVLRRTGRLRYGVPSPIYGRSITVASAAEPADAVTVTAAAVAVTAAAVTQSAAAVAVTAASSELHDAQPLEL